MAETNVHLSIEPCGITQAEGWPDALPAFEAEMSRQLGGKLPAACGEVASIGRWRALRVAPRRFWLVSGDGSKPQVSIDPELGCLVSLDESRMLMRLSGPHSFDILSACVAIDWQAPEAALGRAVQTAFHHVPVLLLRTAADACDLLVPRSFAQSLAEWLAEVAAPYEPRPRERRRHDVRNLQLEPPTG